MQVLCCQPFTCMWSFIEEYLMFMLSYFWVAETEIMCCQEYYSCGGLYEM